VTDSHIHLEMPGGSDPEDLEPRPLPPWARDTEPLVLTLRELSGLSVEARGSCGHVASWSPAATCRASNTLLKIASACGMHLAVGLADPELDAADLCMHRLSLLGIAPCVGRSSRLLRDQGAAPLDRPRMSRATDARSVGETPIASNAAP